MQAGVYRNVGARLNNTKDREDTMPIPHKPFKITTKKGLSRLYDALYKAGQKLLDQYQPCNITPTEEIKIMYGGRKRRLMLCDGHEEPRFCCCGGCRHLGHKGCLVKALGCKLWMCSVGQKWEKHPELERSLRRLRTIAVRHNLMMVRGTKGYSIRTAMLTMKSLRSSRI